MDRWEEQHRLLAATARQNGRVIHDVPGDGSCFYHAVTYSILRTELPSFSDHLRERNCDYMANLSLEVRSERGLPDDQEVASHRNKHGIYIEAQEPWIATMAKEIKCEILVISVNLNTHTTFSTTYEIEDQPEDDSTPLLVLGFYSPEGIEGSGHFVALVEDVMNETSGIYCIKAEDFVLITSEISSTPTIASNLHQERPSDPQTVSLNSPTPPAIPTPSYNRDSSMTQFRDNILGFLPCPAIDCNIWFHVVGELRSHLETHLNGTFAIFTCSQCGYGCSTEAEFKSHSQQHGIEDCFICPAPLDDGQRCDASFPRITAVKTHIQEDLRHCKMRDKGYQCTECWKIYVSEKALKRHLEIHREGKPRDTFLCIEGCGKVFTRKDSMMKHVKRVHKKDGK